MGFKFVFKIQNSNKSEKFREKSASYLGIKPYVISLFLWARGVIDDNVPAIVFVFGGYFFLWWGTFSPGMPLGDAIHVLDGVHLLSLPLAYGVAPTAAAARNEEAKLVAEDLGGQSLDYEQFGFHNLGFMSLVFKRNEKNLGASPWGNTGWDI